jgi:SagB-type dehydrogenase family enzyme
MLRDMAGAGLAVPWSSDDDRDSRLWSPPDLWMHRRSRTGNGGYAGAGFGRTEWATPYVQPARAPQAGSAIALHRPDLDVLRRSDRPLTAVIEDRRSHRTQYDEAPITVNQLGELLYRCAAERTRVGGDGWPTQVSRPYPAGGAAFELELYPVVRHIDGLAAGMYHYEPHGHQLRLVREPGPEVGRLLQAAAESAKTDQPQVLIVIAARFGRLMSAYEELAYSLILKHVGVLYQTLYLVATSMDLAACALGASDALAFTDATGLDYTAESSVGEFMLGSRTPS